MCRTSEFEHVNSKGWEFVLQPIFVWMIFEQEAENGGNCVNGIKKKKKNTRE